MDEKLKAEMRGLAALHGATPTASMVRRALAAVVGLTDPEVRQNVFTRVLGALLPVTRR